MHTRNVSGCHCYKSVCLGPFASTLGCVSSFICFVPWSPLCSNWSGGHLITSGLSLVHWWLLQWTSADTSGLSLVHWWLLLWTSVGSQSWVLLGCSDITTGCQGVSMPGTACLWFILLAWRICLDFCRAVWCICAWLCWLIITGWQEGYW